MNFTHQSVEETHCWVVAFYPKHLTNHQCLSLFPLARQSTLLAVSFHRDGGKAMSNAPDVTKYDL